MDYKQKVIVIVGPTATGKSDVAVRLAKKFNAEVISADSRQVYKGLNIGTGKITKKEMMGVKHHLLDVADPRKQFSVVQYVELATTAITEIASRNKIPIVCGGTGFYIEALIDSVVLPNVSPNKKLRLQLSKKPVPKLSALLKKLDPQRFKTIDKQNIRRVIRAIEIASILGKVPAITRVSNSYDPIFIGLNIPPAELRQRIHLRLRKRLKIGMVAEVQNLHSPKPIGQNLPWKRLDELGLEYRYITLYIQGKLTRAEMIQKLETEIWHYAKRQMTWFRKNKRIRWYKPSEGGEICKTVTRFLVRGST